MTPIRLRHLPLMAALLLPLLAPAASETAPRSAPHALQDTAHAAAHAAALAEYEAGHWSQAYTAFVALADQGHAQAARIALLMAARGPVLYGQAFDASVPQRQRWAAMQVPPLDADFFVSGPLATR